MLTESVCSALVLIDDQWFASYSQGMYFDLPYVCEIKGISLKLVDSLLCVVNSYVITQWSHCYLMLLLIMVMC